MEKLRDAVIRLATEEQRKPLSPSQIALIDHRLQSAFPLGLRTPNHPTYASMILKAIEELSEEGGSSEESISEYMKANYDLPWAHKSYLSNHLDKLCEKGGIVIVADNRYTIPGFTPKNGAKRRRSKRKFGVKQTVSSHEKTQEEENNCEKEELRLVNVKRMRSGRSVLVFQEKDKLLRLTSHRTEDDHLRSGCGNELAIKDQDEQKQQGGEVFGKGDELEENQNKVTDVGVVGKANNHDDKVEGNCEQLPIEDSVGIEGRYLLCERREKNFSAVEDDSSDDHLKITSNKGQPSEILVNEKKEHSIKPKGHVIVCGLAARLPQPKPKQKTKGRPRKQASKSNDQPERHASKSNEQPKRQASKSIEQPKRRASRSRKQPEKLISLIGPSPNTELIERGSERGNPSLSKSKKQPNELISPIGASPNTELIEHGSKRGNSSMSKSKKQPNKLISPIGPSPNSELIEHGSEQGNSSLSKPNEEPSKLISPVDPFPDSGLCVQENEQGNSSASKSKEQPKNLISPTGPIPDPEPCSHENEQGSSSISKSKEQAEKLIPPIDPVLSSNSPEHENQHGNLTMNCENTKVKWPSWVQPLLDTRFFGQCEAHANLGGSLCNSYCLDCKCGALCASCLASHEDHNVIKIRQTMFEDAIDISAIEMHVDIAGIHAQKVTPTDTAIILNRMISVSWHHRSGNSVCRVCQRRVPDPFYFCSLSCKFRFEQ